ncbi:MAG: type II toxin-antitoxin system mRNA interferase toxin, RelE/StbE family [Thermoproteota archaeon]|nr:MAG: type II toxin-antitoxin system mRNA interferase toxin, RelE/StbE family [Candidatus Korarchaeota archaeon]
MPECEVEEKPSFQRALGKLDDRTRARVEEAIQILREKPYLGKPLKGRLRKLWSYRVGKYRVIYLPQPCLVLLVLVGHRESVYS